MEWIIEQLNIVFIVFSSFLYLYAFVYAIKHAWENAKNAIISKKKVCDVCWRDINKVNEALKDE